MRTLDAKIARIRQDSSCRDFILADAKDADMAYGIAAPGTDGNRPRTLPEFRHIIRQNVAQGLIDILLMSASTSEVLTLGERLFDNSEVTPAVRVNDTTDIWLAAGSSYSKQPSRPFRTATIDHSMCGKLTCLPEQRTQGADLGLYSITLNNCVERDLMTLAAYNDFRVEAEGKGFRHFLEVFNPNCPAEPIEDMGRFVNDSIVRLLAGVVGEGRPLFLKIAYNGPAAMEQLASYDPSLIVGILGGSAGTTFDAFHQLWEARNYGARAALYGRMINQSEHQPTFIEHLRWLADGDLNDPAEAVRSYHGCLQRLGIKSHRPLSDDLVQKGRTGAYTRR